MVGDVNGDSHVDILDVALVDRSFGSNRDGQNYNSASDLNNDGKIDILDLAIVCGVFGS